MEEKSLTPQEAKELFSRIHANWQFMNFADQDVFNLWYQMLRPFRFSTLSIAVNEWIRKNSTAPTVSDIIDLVKSIKIGMIDKERKSYNERKERGELCHCPNCKDIGFITYIFPTNVEAIEYCDCEIGRRLSPGLYKFRFPQMLSDIDASIYYGCKLKEFNARTYVKKPAFITWNDENGHHEKPYTTSVVYKITQIGG